MAADSATHVLFPPLTSPQPLIPHATQKENSSNAPSSRQQGVGFGSGSARADLWHAQLKHGSTDGDGGGTSSYHSKAFVDGPGPGAYGGIDFRGSIGTSGSPRASPGSPATSRRVGGTGIGAGVGAESGRGSGGGGGGGPAVLSQGRPTSPTAGYMSDKPRFGHSFSDVPGPGSYEHDANQGVAARSARRAAGSPRGVPRGGGGGGGSGGVRQARQSPAKHGRDVFVSTRDTPGPGSYSAAAKCAFSPIPGASILDLAAGGGARGDAAVRKQQSSGFGSSSKTRFEYVAGRERG